MQVKEFRNGDDLAGLRPAWTALLEQCAVKNTFLTWEWMSAWWSSYGVPEELRLLAAYDGGVLRGIAPLRTQTSCRYKQRVPSLSFVGDGSNDSDYLDFLVAAGYEQPVVDGFLEYLRDDLSRGAVLLLNEIPEDSPSLAAFHGAAGRQGLLLTEKDVPCSTADLPAKWDEYLSGLRPRFRTKVRSVLRNLETRPEIQFSFCRTGEEVQRLLPILFHLHARRWEKDGKPGVFRWERKRDFYFRMAELLRQSGLLRLSRLEWHGQVLACQFGFLYGNTYYHLQEGYEPESEHWNVGIGLRAWSIRQLQAEGCREYDFLGGVGRHKLDWGSRVKHSKQLAVARRTFKTLIFCRGPEWETATRESIKQLVPTRVLEARTHWLQSRTRVADGPAPADSHGERGWLRQAAAGTYFHSGLPRVMRSVRERYELSLPNGHADGGFSCTRRKRGSARIFCYHRVNNDGDPFFPAISSDLFERQMAFVARYYKVVSLSDALRCIEGDSREPVLAITFDDGYLDNYQYAFPILQRYGIAATIFLTTGGLDSGEPLWFEKLAEALKKSGKEYLDIEVDIPRRLWLRTEGERLEANSRAVELLRGLPDPERHEHLDEIFRRLDFGGDCDRRGKMLAWDQVRDMARHGIDFGGHTVTHPFLSRVPEERVAWEVGECKRRIEEELDRGVQFFAYPNGREQDFRSENKDVLRAVGYRAAVTTIWGVNDRATDPMELRRSSPWESDPALFASKLDWYQLING